MDEEQEKTVEARLWACVEEIRKARMELVNFRGIADGDRKELMKVDAALLDACRIMKRIVQNYR